MEKRLLLAFVISAAILLGWSLLFPPPDRQEPTPATAKAPEAASATDTVTTAESDKPMPTDD